MPRNRDNAPVGNTCPMIDGVLDCIHTLYKSSEEMSKGELDYMVQTLEKIRHHNEELRSWGNEECDKATDLEKELDNSKDEVSALEEDIKEYKSEIKELENQLFQLENSTLHQNDAECA